MAETGLPGEKYEHIVDTGAYVRPKRSFFNQLTFKKKLSGTI